MATKLTPIAVLRQHHTENGFYWVSSVSAHYPMTGMFESVSKALINAPDVAILMSEQGRLIRDSKEVIR